MVRCFNSVAFRLRLAVAHLRVVGLRPAAGR